MILMRPSLHTPYTEKWTVFVVIVVPAQSAPITTSVVSSNPAHNEAYWIQHYVIMLVSEFQRSFFSPVSPTSKADGQDMANILLEVVLNTITQNAKHRKYRFSFS